MNNDAITLIEELGAFARDRIGVKASLAAPKIEALVRKIPEGERSAWCRELLTADPEARPFRAFAEALLVHETYFFRHPDQLRLLSDEIFPRLLRERIDAGSREMRVWCAGCSSGEEVYSVALLLQSALAKSEQPGARNVHATVLGTDLSWQSIEQAQRGEYWLAPGLNSFRDVPDFARHHFASILGATATTWSASPELKRLTRFQRHNLVTDPPALLDVDVVLCRNTLIYFDEERSRAALQSIESALRPSGVLLLGPAEMPRSAPRLQMTCTDHAVFWTKTAEGTP